MSSAQAAKTLQGAALQRLELEHLANTRVASREKRRLQVGHAAGGGREETRKASGRQAVSGPHGQRHSWAGAGGLEGHGGPAELIGGPLVELFGSWSLPLFYRLGKLSWVGSDLASVAELVGAGGRADPRSPRPVHLSVATWAGLGGLKVGPNEPRVRVSTTIREERGLGNGWLASDGQKHPVHFV